MRFTILSFLALEIVGASLTPTPTIQSDTTQPAMTAYKTATAPINATITSEYAPDPTPTPQPPARAFNAPQTSGSEIPNNSKYDWMAAAGIPQSDWQYVDAIISKESGWRHTVWNSQGSGAYGLCQSKPATKMASAGADYMTNPVTQLKWCTSYAQQRYQGWQNAWTEWSRKLWW